MMTVIQISRQLCAIRVIFVYLPEKTGMTVIVFALMSIVGLQVIPLLGRRCIHV